MELQSRAAEIARQGLGLAAVSYDAPDILKRFSQSRGITFPLIADEGSAIIRRFGLLNVAEPPGTRGYGIPYPGTFIVDRQGVVRSRHFEEAYQERNTVANLLVQQGVRPLGPVATSETPHLIVMAAVSDDEVAPGKRVSLVFDITPRRGMHVYAPGRHAYQVVRFTLDAQPWLRAHAPVYPRSEIFHFKPLDERVEVYQKPFRLVQDVTVLATPEAQKTLASQSTLKLSGRLEYQACDDKICYTPQTVKLAWTVGLKPLDRKPAGE